jgi:hypothetical protein
MDYSGNVSHETPLLLSQRSHLNVFARLCASSRDAGERICNYILLFNEPPKPRGEH